MPKPTLRAHRYRRSGGRSRSLRQRRRAVVGRNTSPPRASTGSSRTRRTRSIGSSKPTTTPMGKTAGEAFISAVGATAMGATTYEWVLDHEKLLEHPVRWRDFYGDIPCWVFTHRDLPGIPDADVRFVQGDVRPIHAEMATAASGNNIWLVGGGELVGRFADAGLLDEIQLHVAPVTLGGGAPLLPRRITASRLLLTAAEMVDGFAYLTYRVG